MCVVRPAMRTHACTYVRVCVGACVCVRVQVTRDTGPCLATIRSKLASHPFGGASKEHAEELFPFCINCTKCFKYHCTKDIVGALETHIVFAAFLSGGIPFTRLLHANIRGASGLVTATSIAIPFL